MKIIVLIYIPGLTISIMRGYANIDAIDTAWKHEKVIFTFSFFLKSYCPQISFVLFLSYR